jgi:hypothetical protein
MDDSQKADLLSFVRDDGKGFIGIHSAAITFLSWPQYGKMLGGYFDGHPWGEFKAPLVVEDSGFPGMGHLPRNFTLQDEIYQIKDFSRDNVRVLLRLDASKIDLSRKGLGRAFRRRTISSPNRIRTFNPEVNSRLLTSGAVVSQRADRDPEPTISNLRPAQESLCCR